MGFRADYVTGSGESRFPLCNCYFAETWSEDDLIVYKKRGGRGVPSVELERSECIVGRLPFIWDEARIRGSGVCVRASVLFQCIPCSRGWLGARHGTISWTGICVEI